jgi:hypothetical protein
VIDRGLKFDNRAKHPSFEAPPGELGEKPFDGIQPGSRCPKVDFSEQLCREHEFGVGTIAGAHPGVLSTTQAKEYAHLQAQIDEVYAKLMAWHKADECSQRLASMPSAGRIGAMQRRTA